MHDHKEIFHFIEISIIDVHAKFALEWQSLIGANTIA